MKDSAEQVWKPVGDQGLMIQVGRSISPAVHQRVQSWCQLLKKEQLVGVLEWLPTYTSVMIYYDPYVISFGQLVAKLKQVGQDMEVVQERKKRLIRLPVCYGGSYGPDLQDVADYHALDPDEVVHIHSAQEYKVYMIGFAPGFPYLGGMSSRIATPRLKQPRTLVPKGSVGIADQQTGVYSMATPGGWRIIGRTPLSLFDVNRTPPSLVQAGDSICFDPIDEEEFHFLSGEEEEDD